MQDLPCHHESYTPYEFVLLISIQSDELALFVSRSYCGCFAIRAREDWGQTYETSDGDDAGNAEPAAEMARVAITGAQIGGGHQLTSF